jgi:hypothetical protein
MHPESENRIEYRRMLSTPRVNRDFPSDPDIDSRNNELKDYYLDYRRQYPQVLTFTAPPLAVNASTPGPQTTSPIEESFPVSSTVVNEVASVAGVDQLDLPPIALSIDPDALDEVVESIGTVSGAPTGQVTFPYAGYEVTVRSDGTVDVVDQHD